MWWVKRKKTTTTCNASTSQSLFAIISSFLSLSLCSFSHRISANVIPSISSFVMRWTDSIWLFDVFQCSQTPVWWFFDWLNTLLWKPLQMPHGLPRISGIATVMWLPMLPLLLLSSSSLSSSSTTPSPLPLSSISLRAPDFSSTQRFQHTKIITAHLLFSWKLICTRYRIFMRRLFPFGKIYGINQHSQKHPENNHIKTNYVIKPINRTTTEKYRERDRASERWRPYTLSIYKYTNIWK